MAAGQKTRRTERPDVPGQSCAFDAERQNVARQNTQTEQTQAYANGDGGRRAALLREKARLPIGVPSFWLVPRLV